MDTDTEAQCQQQHTPDTANIDETRTGLKTNSHEEINCFVNMEACAASTLTYIDCNLRVDQSVNQMTLG